MTDRAHTITVVLDKDYRTEDDLIPILEAIRMIKGVVAADANVSDATEYMAHERATLDLKRKILDLLA